MISPGLGWPHRVHRAGDVDLSEPGLFNELSTAAAAPQKHTFKVGRNKSSMHEWPRKEKKIS